MIDVVKGIVSALHIHMLARYPANRISIRSQNCMPIDVGLLYSPSDNIKQVALCALLQGMNGPQQQHMPQQQQLLTPGVHLQPNLRALSSFHQSFPTFGIH